MPTRSKARRLQGACACAVQELLGKSPVFSAHRLGSGGPWPETALQWCQDASQVILPCSSWVPPARPGRADGLHV